jgi:alpha-tubulin suppressor-like RCC1 family protein
MNRRCLTFAANPATNTSRRRRRAVYAVGDGWTGALGTGRVDQCIPGHFVQEEMMEYTETSQEPICVYEFEDDKDTNHFVSTGWGHSALVDHYRLFLCGRPHEFSALMRLRKFPRRLRHYLARLTMSTLWPTSFATTTPPPLLSSSPSLQPLSFPSSPEQPLLPLSTTADTSSSSPVPAPPVGLLTMDSDISTTPMATDSGVPTSLSSLPPWYHPTVLVNRCVTWLADLFESPQQRRDSHLGRQVSFLVWWTEFPIFAVREEASTLSPATSAITTSNHHLTVTDQPLSPPREPWHARLVKHEIRTRLDRLVQEEQDTDIVTDSEAVRVTSVVCGAGTTAVLDDQGRLYMFGLNAYGQCGVGHASNNVWRPTRVTGLSTEFSSGRTRADLSQSHAIQQVALGLQHGYALNTAGQVFAWGKGERGQLGQEEFTSESHTALPIRKYCRFSGNRRPEIHWLPPVRQIASGLLHGAALLHKSDQGAEPSIQATDSASPVESSPQVVVWGKHVLPPDYMDVVPKFNDGGTNKSNARALDSRLPFVIEMPHGLEVCQIACGTHHTAMLCTDGSVWAVGMTTDTNEVLIEPVNLIPAGMVALPENHDVRDSPVGFFAAHADRTTVIGRDGQQVLQAHLWGDAQLQQDAVFTPSYVDQLLRQNLAIKEIHRSWIHTLIVTS